MQPQSSPKLEQWNRRADLIGGGTLALLRGFARYFDLLRRAFAVAISMQWLRRPAVMHVVIRQIYFTGVQSLPWVVLMSLFIGTLAVYNIVLFAKNLQDLSLIGTMISGVLVREMAPLLIAIFMLARSGVAVVTEIGNMHIRGEESLLQSLGIDRCAYLIFPRLLAFALCGLVLTFLFTLLAVWAGGVAVAASHTLNFTQFLLEMQRGTSLSEVALMMFKGGLYPMLCCALLIDQGGMVGRDPNQIPVRATHGVLGSLMLILLLDGVLALLATLILPLFAAA